MLARLMRYDWPGNVRELRNAVTVALALNDGGPLDIASHLGSLSDISRAPLVGGGHAAPNASEAPTGRFKDAKQDALSLFESAYFTNLVKEAGGNISEIARRSGLERAHVRMYLRKHDLASKS